MRKQILSVLLGGSSCLLALPAASASLYEEQALSFGTVVIKDNTIAGSVTVPISGPPSSSEAVLILKPGSPAEFILNDYPPNTKLTITPLERVQIRVPSGTAEPFTLEKVLLPDSVMTDGTGAARIKMGGILNTSATGGHYPDDTYEAKVYMDISY